MVSHRLVLIVLLLTTPLAAHAYVDPGSGMLVWQSLLAVLGGAIVFFRRGMTALRRLLAWFRQR